MSLDVEQPNGMVIVPTHHGWRWIVRGWSLFRASPFMWMTMLFAYWLLMGVAGLAPYVGAAVAVVLIPAFTVSFMAMCRELELGRPLVPGLLIAGFRANLPALVARRGVGDARRPGGARAVPAGARRVLVCADARGLERHARDPGALLQLLCDRRELAGLSGVRHGGGGGRHADPRGRDRLRRRGAAALAGRRDGRARVRAGVLRRAGAHAVRKLLCELPGCLPARRPSAGAHACRAR